MKNKNENVLLQFFFLIRFIVFQEIWWDNNVEISCRQINKGWYTAQICDGTTTLPQQKCHILDITTLNCSNFEGKTLAVQSVRFQHQYVHRGPEFNSWPRQQQIVMNFTTNLSYFSQTTAISTGCAICFGHFSIVLDYWKVAKTYGTPCIYRPIEW